MINVLLSRINQKLAVPNSRGCFFVIGGDSVAKLTTKQKAFIQSYCGNATEAALKAGYSKKTARSIGNENLTKPHIIAAIKKREEKRTNNRIATREERQIFWTQTMKDEKAISIHASV